MKKTTEIHRMTALLLVCTLLLAAAPFSAPAAYAADTAYNAHDLQKVQAFLRLEDDNGKTNAEKMGWDIENPASWPDNIQWILVNDELRLEKISLDASYEAHGALDVSGCTSLKTLDCSFNFDHQTNNQLTALDVSGCTALERLVCYYNQLTTLDVSGCTALEYLVCYYNPLTALDVSDCTALTVLSCVDNQLTALDVSNNTALEVLACSRNPLTALDVSKNTALNELHCDYNQLAALDVSKNTRLKSLICSNNQLTTLDVSQNTALNYLLCNRNQLTALDVSKNIELVQLNCDTNQLTALDLSKNIRLFYVRAHKNPLDALALTALKTRGYHYITYTECGYNCSVVIDSYFEKIMTVKSIGNGFVDISFALDSTIYLTAIPEDINGFIEWRDADGLSTIKWRDISSYYYCSATSTANTMSVTAVFSGANVCDLFSDVRQDDWYYDAVDFVYWNKLFKGAGETTFEPESKMTRAMFVTALGRMAEGMGEDISGYTHEFEDVKSGEYYTDYVAWASAKGLVEGYNSTIFGTDDDITREQMAVLLVRFADYMNITLENDEGVQFTDKSSVSDWAQESVERASRACLIDGYDDSTFRPEQPAKRCEVAQLFMNF